MVGGVIGVRIARLWPVALPLGGYSALQQYRKVDSE